MSDAGTPQRWQDHPRPWKVLYNAVHDADGMPVFRFGSGRRLPDRQLAELIVRVINAEPEIVAALEAADDALGWCGRQTSADAAALVRAALAKVRP
jgi:hypothetical protein